MLLIAKSKSVGLKSLLLVVVCCSFVLCGRVISADEEIDPEGTATEKSPAQVVTNAEVFWNVDEGIQLYHFSHGKGKAALVIHGGPGFPYRNPWPGLESLTDEYEFVYYDQRGCGNSTRPIDSFETGGFRVNFASLANALGLMTQVSDIERIRKILGQEKLILIGRSFGAFIATMYAIDHPERIEALILVAPANVLVMPQEDGGLFETMKLHLPDRMQQSFSEFLGRYFDFSSIFSETEADLISLNCEIMPYYTEAAANKGFIVVPDYSCEIIGGWMVQGIYLTMGMQYDHRPRLKVVEAPVLVLHGSKDLQTEAASRIYSDAFPDATFRVIENAGHFMFNDYPDEFGKVVRQFLSGEH